MLKRIKCMLLVILLLNPRAYAGDTVYQVPHEFFDLCHYAVEQAYNKTCPEAAAANEVEAEFFYNHPWFIQFGTPLMLAFGAVAVYRLSMFRDWYLEKWEQFKVNVCKLNKSPAMLRVEAFSDLTKILPGVIWLEFEKIFHPAIRKGSQHGIGDLEGVLVFRTGEKEPWDEYFVALRIFEPRRDWQVQDYQEHLIEVEASLEQSVLTSQEMSVDQSHTVQIAEGGRDARELFSQLLDEAAAKAQKGDASVDDQVRSIWTNLQLVEACGSQVIFKQNRDKSMAAMYFGNLEFLLGRYSSTAIRYLQTRNQRLTGITATQNQNESFEIDMSNSFEGVQLNPSQERDQ